MAHLRKHRRLSTSKRAWLYRPGCYLERISLKCGALREVRGASLGQKALAGRAPRQALDSLHSGGFDRSTAGGQTDWAKRRGVRTEPGEEHVKNARENECVEVRNVYYTYYI